MFIIFQSGLIPLVHANRGINMYYNRLYHPSRNINHLFRKSVKRYSARFTPFLSARERAMDIIKQTEITLNGRFIYITLLDKNLSASSAAENFIRFIPLFPLNYITLCLSIFLLRREAVCFTTFYLSTLPINQSKSSIGNVSLLHFYRLQAVCDFLGRIPSADTSLHERNSEMISVYSQRPTHESLRISSTNSPDCLTFRIEMTGIILFFTEFCCRISYFS